MTLQNGEKMKKFSDSGLRPSIVEALEFEKIVEPTEVQAKAIPIILEKADLIAQSETGTGKTLAYLLPIFEHIANAEFDGNRVIILVPTHELAAQVLRQIERLTANSGLPIRSAMLIGNVNIDRQIEKLREKPHIIVGSAGRVLELIKKRKINAQAVKLIVLDEADRLMSDENAESTLAVIKTTQKDRQMLAFSATIPPNALARLTENMKTPKIIKSEAPISVPETISHFYKLVAKRDKAETLRKMIRSLSAKKSLIFMNNSHELEIVLSKLCHHDLRADSLHGDNRKSERKRTLDDFRAGKVDILIASDIAARGLQIDGITHVFIMTMSENPQDYVHRAGRTGRNGQSGAVVSIVTEFELGLLKAHAKRLGIVLSEI